MNKKITAMAAATCILTAFLTACGHNAIQYGDGLGFDASLNPENYSVGFNLRYGKILSAVTRDNVEIEVTSDTNADGTAGAETTGKASIGSAGNLKIKIGRQINGAAVDMVEAGADAEKVLETLSGDITATEEKDVEKQETATVPVAE